MVSPPNRPGRAASRFLAGLSAVLFERGTENPCAAQNLSRTGVLLVGNMPRPTSPIVEVRLRSAAGDLEVLARARIIRAQPDEEGEMRVGVEFLDLDEAQRETLEALVARVVEGVTPAPIAELSASAGEGEIRAALERVSVPHRIALAGRAQPKEREILLRDSNPQVLEALARNPNLLKHEVLTLLRLHTILPTTLEILARDTRWSGDEEMKILIGSHPRASFALADRLVQSLSPEGIKRIVQRPGLNAGLRMKLTSKLSRGPGGR